MAARALWRAAAAGVGLAIGSDTAAAGSLIFQAQLAFFGHKEAWADDRLVTPRQALGWLTLDAARVLGLDRDLGSLVPGKAADLVLIRTDALRWLPFPDKLLGLWRVGSAADVDTVVVGGQVLVRGGVPSAVDYGAVTAAAEAAACRFMARLAG